MELNEMLKRIQDSKKSLVSKKIGKIPYQAGPTATYIVMREPERFIIPECLECCKLLWSKGIDTYQCGNYDDALENGFWVEIDNTSLSEDNENLFRSMAENDDRVFFAENLAKAHNYVIRVKRDNNPNASQELCDIVANLLLQDTTHYRTSEELLDEYKRAGGKMSIDKKGYLHIAINPERADATLDDALQDVRHPELYVAEEGRLYLGEYALEVHQNYLKQVKKM